jgi:hypothetical protein
MRPSPLASLLACFSLQACGSTEPDYDIVYGSPELEALTKEYISSARAAKIKIFDNELVLVKVGKLPDGAPPAAAGVCLSRAWDDGTREKGSSRIILGTLAWSLASDCDKKRLLFHELGHCLSHKVHTEGLGETLMSPVFSFDKTHHNCEITKQFFTNGGR